MEFKLVHMNSTLMPSPFTSFMPVTLRRGWLSLPALRAAYACGELTPSGCIRRLYAEIAASDRPEAWILLLPEEVLLDRAQALDDLLRSEGAALLQRYPLFGAPFAVKDNIDVTGVPTTAACPAYAYLPEQTAPAVQRLLDGHALLLGKTNMDQFATGLVGTRSPYGTVRQVDNADHISGGSSSGSAVVVAQGLASFALGTDTAGSGRVPAGLNGIVGLKPTRGLVSSRGMVPACRSLDCLSVFAADVEDAWTVLQQIAAEDVDDPYSRAVGAAPPAVRDFTLGVPRHCEFYGDGQASEAFASALRWLADYEGCSVVEVDAQPLLDSAALLYEGPWIAERRAAVGTFLDTHGAAVDPVVRDILRDGDGPSAVDLFRGEYRLAGYRRQARALFAGIDALLVPTAPIHPSIEAVNAQPLELNRQLGHYTNFVNLLDLAGIAVPAALRGDGLPFGVTLLAPAGHDHRLAVLAQRLQGVFCGSDAPAATLAAQPLPFAEATVDVAVVGAHLSGQPLNWQLLECGARLLCQTRTSAHYRLYALAGTVPAKPGLVRTEAGGAAIEIEVWRMPRRLFGGFVEQQPAPMAIVSLELADGRWVKGFVCEPWVLSAATDVTVHGGWRAYLASKH